MSDKANPSLPTADPTKDDRDPVPPAGSERSLPSIAGLAAVSVLNLICLAFIAYHFSTHPHDVTSASTLPLAELRSTDAESKPDARTALGNVDLVPVVSLVVEIASSIASIDVAASDRPRASRPPQRDQEANIDPGAVARHWVQLGALSEEKTARLFWSSLKRRHGALLEDREPDYFGPDDVGGQLFHIRVGPMDGNAADQLCANLQADGADCFCVVDGHD